jgi:hypothetical protein
MVTLAAGALAASMAPPVNADETRPPDPAAGAAVIRDGVEVAVTGHFFPLGDAEPGQPDAFVRTADDIYVPVDRAGLAPEISPADTIAAVVEIPGEAVADLPPADLALLVEADAASPGPLPATDDAAVVALEAAAQTGTEVAVAESAVVASAAQAAAAVPGPYQHTFHVVFMSSQNRGVFWTQTQLDDYMQRLNDFWVREGRGAITSITYDWNEVIGITSTVQCGGSLQAIQNAATTARAAASLTNYDWLYNQSQHHLIVLTPSEEESLPGCRHGYGGLAWVLNGFESGGAMHNIVSVNENTSQLTWAGEALAHETGHNFGLEHAGEFFCPVGHSEGSLGGNPCYFIEYGNDFNVMGNNTNALNYPLNAFQKTKTSLIDEGEGYITLADGSASGVYTLARADTQDTEALQGIRIVENAGLAHRTYWLDYYPMVQGGAISVTRTGGGSDDPDIGAYGAETVILSPHHLSSPYMHERGNTFFSISGRLRVTVLGVGPDFATVRIDLAPTRFDLNVSRSTWYVPSAGGSAVVGIDAEAGSWQAQADQPWLAVSPTSSTNRTATMTAQPFASGLRVGTVTVSSVNSTEIITVIQSDGQDACANSTATTCEFDSTSPYGAEGALEVGSDVDYWRFTAPTSGTWSFRSLWAHGDVVGQLLDSTGTPITSDSGSAGGPNFLMSATLTANQVVYVAVANTNSSNTNTNTGSYILRATPATISLTMSQWNPRYAGGSETLDVTSTTGQFTATSSATWLSVTPASGTDALNRTEVSLDADPNPGAARTATVTFTSGTASATVTVIQEEQPFVALFPDSLTLNRLSGQYPVEVDTLGLVPWTVTSLPAWVSVTPSAGNPGDTVTVAVQANPMRAAARTGDVVFETAQGSTNLSISQSEGDDHGDNAAAATEWDIATQSQMLGTLDPGIDRDYFGFIAPVTGQYSFRSGPSTGNIYGLLLSASGSLIAFDDNGGDFPNFLITETLTAGTRYYLDIDNVGADPPVTGPYTITVTVPATTLSLSATTWAAPWTGGTTQVSVATNVYTWSASSDATWLSVSPASGEDGDSVTLTADANSGAQRTATVTLSAGSAEETIEVTQAAAPPPTVSVSASTWSATPAPDSTSVTVTTNLATWTASSSAAWLSVSPATGANGGTMTLSTIWNTGGARTATVTVTAGAAQATVTVTQAALPPGSVCVSQTSWAAPYTAASYPLLIETNQPAWTVTSNSPWLTVSPATGPSGSFTMMTVQANPGPERIGTIRAEGGGAWINVVVTQAAAPPTPTVTVSQPTWAAPSAADSTSVTVTTNQATWTASSDAAWLSASPTTGINGDVVTLTAQANPGAARTGTVTVTAGVAEATIDVTQAAAPVPPSVVLSIPSWSIQSPGGATSIVVTTNQATWTASSDAAWLTASPASGASGATLSVTAETNWGAARTGTVTVSAGGVHSAVSVTQGAAPAATLTLSKTSWSPVVGGATTTVKVTTNRPEWSSLSTVPWVQAGITTGVSGATVTLVATRNYGPARTGDVVFTVAGMERVVTIKQAAGPKPTLTLARSTYTPDAEGGSIGVKVTTNQEFWFAESDSPWILTYSNPGISGDSVSISTPINTAPTKRIGHITVTVTGPLGQVTKVITVTQGEASVRADQSTWAPSASGARVTPKITTNQPGWVASSDSPWLTVGPASGISGDEMVWAAQWNRSAKRVGHITLTAGGATTVVTVTQAAGPTATATLSRTTWAAPASAGSVGMSVTTNQPQWCAVADDAWLAVSEPCGVSGRTIVVSAQENAGSASRVGTLTVTAGTVSRVLKVTQAAGSVRIVPSDVAWAPAAGGGALTLSAVVSTGAAWKVKTVPTWVTASSKTDVASGGTVVLTAAANATTSRRSGTVTLGSGTATATVTVVQDTTRSVKVTPASWTVARTGGSLNVSVGVFNDSTWTVTSNQPWLIAGPAVSPSDGTLVLVAEPNNGGQERTAVVSVESEGVTTTLTVTQRG